jgi:hypothetical protein
VTVTFADDAADVLENASVNIDVLANDEDVDAGDIITIESVTSPVMKDNIEIGTAEIVTINDHQQIKFTPNATFDSLSVDAESDVIIDYKIKDSQNATSDGQVVVTVTGVNDGPVAADDTAEVLENASVIIDALANDKDVDADDTLTIDSVTSPVIRDNIEVGVNSIVWLGAVPTICAMPTSILPSMTGEVTACSSIVSPSTSVSLARTSIVTLAFSVVVAVSASATAASFVPVTVTVA